MNPFPINLFVSNEDSFLCLEITAHHHTLEQNKTTADFENHMIISYLTSLLQKMLSRESLRYTHNGASLNIRVRPKISEDVQRIVQ